MIFQEPMTSLNPVYTIGFQIEEVLRKHRGMSRAAARNEAARTLGLFARPGTYSIEKARRLLGFEPKVDLADGMCRTESWARERGLI